MKTRLQLLCLCFLLAATPQTCAAGPEDSVVRVFASVRYPNPLQPWSTGQAVEVFGSGAVIEEKKILTNAHRIRPANRVLDRHDVILHKEVLHHAHEQSTR